MTERTLSDADVEAIAEKVLETWEAKFYGNLGKGVWSVIWKLAVGAMIAVASWGAATGGKFNWPSGTP